MNQVSSLDVSNDKKRIRVAAGIILDVITQCVLVSQRKLDAHQGGRWEFPGGKVENDESFEQALVREIKEELNLKIRDPEMFDCVVHEYQEKIVELNFFLVKNFSGEVKSMEGQRFAWMNEQQLSQLQFPDANVDVQKKLIAFLRHSKAPLNNSAPTLRG